MKKTLFAYDIEPITEERLKELSKLSMQAPEGYCIDVMKVNYWWYRLWIKIRIFTLLTASSNKKLKEPLNEGDVLRR